MNAEGDLIRLRELVACGSRDDALAIVDHYSSAVEQFAAGRPAGDRETVRAVDEALQLLGWTRRVIAADRSRAASALSRLASSRRYSARSQPAPHWRVDG